jgi:cytochrome c peroxidase
MKKKILAALVVFISVAVWIAGCKKNTIDPGKWQPISFNVPKGWPEPAYKFENNPLTYDGFVLGRKLFYDVRLSVDSTVSCGTCHQQFAGFAQLGHDLSHGVKDLLGTRNSPGLANMAWHTSFFWDGGVNHLENQPISPIENPVEMALPFAEAVDRVRKAEDYRSYFKNAFGDETINSQRMLRAMAQFMGAMVSADSKYDKYVRAEAGGTLTQSELNGLTIFRQHCATCHKEPLMSDFSFRNNGLRPSAVNDSGRAHITKDAADLYKFKVPSLRNVALTAPYMHDGKVRTLEDAVEHYRSRIHPSETLDPLLSAGIALTDNEKHDVVNFLKTLTDSTFIRNPLFAEPNN